MGRTAAITITIVVVIITTIADTVGRFPLSTGAATTGWKRWMIGIVLIEMIDSSFVFES